MNLTKQIKSAPLPPGFFSVCGCQGAGKTSLVTALLRADYKKWRKWRYQQGQALADEYYRVNGIKLDVSQNLYFSNTPILLDRRRKIYTHAIELEELGLPNDDYEVQYLPCGSVVFIQEADVLAWCRDWATLNEYLRALLKYVRHNFITIIFDMQYGGDLDKALRTLVVGSYYVTESGIKRYWLFWKKQRWDFIYNRVQLNNAVKELSQMGVKIKVPIYEWGKFYTRGNVFDCYDSFSGKRYFLYKIDEKGYTYKEHVNGSVSVEDVNAFVNAHPLKRSEENKRQTGRRNVKDNSPPAAA